MLEAETDVGHPGDAAAANCSSVAGCGCVGTRTTLFSVLRWGAPFPHAGGEVGLPVPPSMTVREASPFR